MKSVSIRATPMYKEPSQMLKNDRYDLSNYLIKESPEKNLIEQTCIQLRYTEPGITYRKKSIASLKSDAEKVCSEESETKECSSDRNIK